MNNKLYIVLLSVLALSACTERIKIDGTIEGASKQTIYIEEMKLSSIEMVDSVRTSGKGKFSVKIDRPRYPSLYRLSLNGQNIILGADSATEQITIKAAADSLINADILGSESSADIQRLRRSSVRLQQYARERNEEKVDQGLKEHRSLAIDIILKDTRSAAAYYAVYQTTFGYYYINPLEKEGLQLWSAVATAFDVYFPDYDRSKELKETVLAAMRQKRIEQINPEEILESAEQQGFIEITLPGRDDQPVSLSSLKGQVVLVDFTAYQTDQAVAHTLFLRELHEKYRHEGFEIYQVSLDPNKLLWLEQTASLPWICVRDKNAPDCKYLYSYNVTELPTFFLIDRNGDIVGRYNHENVETELRTFLQ